MQYNSPDALTFAPVVPQSLKADREIKNFRYRDASLDITVKGYGDVIKSFAIDGEVKDQPEFGADLSGQHTIEIVLADTFRNHLSTNMVGNVRTPLIPFVRFRSGESGLRWYMVEGAQRYDVYAGGKKVLETTDSKCRIKDTWSGDLQVVAVAADGTPSFPSEPLNRNEKISKQFEPVMLLGQSGKDFTIEMTVPHDGVWNLSWNYANGRGSLFSDLTCGIRMLYVDGSKYGIDIFPNRKDAGGAPGTYVTDGWDLWGWTSPHKVVLKAGKHKFTLKCEPDTDNMSLKVNDFMLKGCRLTLDHANTICNN